MKKLLSLLLVFVGLIATAQTLTKTKVLKTTDMGNQKLEMVIRGGDTVYAMKIKSQNIRNDVVVVALGDRQNALRLLNILKDVELSGDDALNLENETQNVVKKNPMGGFAVFHELGVKYGQLRKQNIKGFIKVLEGME